MWYICHMPGLLTYYITEIMNELTNNIFQGNIFQIAAWSFLLVLQELNGIKGLICRVLCNTGMWLCVGSICKRKRERESLAERLGGCMPEWEKQQSLSRRTQEILFSNVSQLIFPIKSVSMALTSTNDCQSILCVKSCKVYVQQKYSKFTVTSEKTNFKKELNSFLYRI